MATLFLPFGYPGYPQVQLAEHIAKSEAWLKEIGADVVAAPNVIVLADCEKAIEVAKSDVWDAVIVLIASWIEAPNALKVLSAAGLEQTPMLLWSHDNYFDPKEKATISFGCIASAGVMRETFEEFDYKFRFVVGNPGDEVLAGKIISFLQAARTVRQLKDARLGMLGYVSMGMYTGLGDHVKVKKVFGTEIVHIDQYSLIAHLDEASTEEIAAEKQALKEQWDVAGTISDSLLDRNASVYLRLKQLVKEHQLDALTAKCQYEMSIDWGFTPCVALSLLGANMPVSCEGDIYLLISQMILEGIAKETTTYGDVLAFLSDGVICAACGFAPKSFLAADRPKIDKHTALYSGLLITTPFKRQDVTVIRLANDKQGFKMHVIEGHVEEMKDFHEIDCPAYAGSVIKFHNKSVEDFQQEIMSQHYAIVPGNHGDAVREFCKLMNIRVV